MPRLHSLFPSRPCSRYTGSWPFLLKWMKPVSRAWISLFPGSVLLWAAQIPRAKTWPRGGCWSQVVVVDRAWVLSRGSKCKELQAPYSPNSSPEKKRGVGCKPEARESRVLNLNLAFQFQVPSENTIKFGGLEGHMGREFFVWTGCGKAKCLGILIRRILTFPRHCISLFMANVCHEEEGLTGKWAAKSWAWK